MLIKQVQFKGIDDQGHIFCQPLLLDHGLTKTAEALDMRSKLHPRVQDFVRAIRPSGAGIYVLVSALGAGEYWGSNVNGDLFPEKGLINAPADWEGILAYPDRARQVGMAWPFGYPTFMGAHPYKHHVNKDPSRAFGRVELATWNPSMHRVELVVYLDRALCMQFDAMDIIQRIEAGEFPDVSMGCKVPYDVCTICENQSKTRVDYCEHALRMMNKILPDGRKVAVRNDFPKFFDISFVFIGAAKEAKVMAKLAQKGNQVCMGDFCTVPRLSAEVGEVFTKEAMTLAELEIIGDVVAGAGAGIYAGVKDKSVKSGLATGGGAMLGGLVGGAAGSFAPIKHLIKGVLGGQAVGATAGALLGNHLYNRGKTKTADPEDELPSNIGYTKERALAEQLTRPPVKQTTRDEGSGRYAATSGLQSLIEKTASKKLHNIAKGTLIGAGIGTGASIVGSASIKADKESRRKEAVKDTVAGGVAGALAKLGSYKYPTLSSYLKKEASDPAMEKNSSNELKGYQAALIGALGGGVGGYGGRKLFDRLIGGTPPSHREALARGSAVGGAASGAMLGYMVNNLAKQANDPIKKKVKVQGIPVWIEWLKGETREYKKGGVVKYTRLMEADYGYIPGTVDSDGEELDVYLGPDKAAKNAYVIRQLKKTGGFDEHKVMLGFSSKAAAKASYVHHMGGTPERFGGMQAIPVSSLVALYGDNKAQKEKHASCSCQGVGEDCGGSIEKLAAAVFPISKSASHAKLSELIKSIPAGPFTQETLPRLESAEKDIPNDVLDMMGGLPLGDALSTPTMAGMVLKPREFQRVILMSIGERPLADELDNKGMTFGRTNEVDDSIQLNESSVDSGLMGLLRRLGLVGARSAAAPALQRRTMASATADQPFSPLSEKTASGPLMKKLAAAYNGYRRNVLRKAASISNFMTNDPQLRAELFGSSMVQAFAGGVDKVATASVLSPDSLAYLVGAYTDRDLHMTKEVVASLALTGAMAEAA